MLKKTRAYTRYQPATTVRFPPAILAAATKRAAALGKSRTQYLIDLVEADVIAMAKELLK